MKIKKQDTYPSFNYNIMPLIAETAVDILYHSRFLFCFFFFENICAICPTVLSFFGQLHSEYLVISVILFYLSLCIDD